MLLIKENVSSLRIVNFRYLIVEKKKDPCYGYKKKKDKKCLSYLSAMYPIAMLPTKKPIPSVAWNMSAYQASAHTRSNCNTQVS